MVADPQCVGIIDRLDDLFGLFSTPGSFTSDVQEMTMPALLSLMSGLCGQLSNCAIGIDSLLETDCCIGISASVGALLFMD
ncbi:MAG: hypothetical protein P8163_18375 [Candidatus Thiodiazotropha sp.]